MRFPAITLHMELEFDSAIIEPDPWWRPFCWYRLHQEEAGGHWHRVLRLGALGFHVCVSAAWYPPEGQTPKVIGE